MDAVWFSVFISARLLQFIMSHRVVPKLVIVFIATNAYGINLIMSEPLKDL